MGKGDRRRDNSGGCCDLDFDRFGSDIRPVRTCLRAGVCRTIGALGWTYWRGAMQFSRRLLCGAPPDLRRITNGVAVGFFLAILDVVLLVASQEPFQLLFVVSI
jgi:hypothetical protein